MDYLFREVLPKIPENYTIQTYYIVNENLKYVSLLKGDTYYLGYVDTDHIGDFIIDSKIEGDLDYYVIKENYPVLKVSSSYKDSLRVVEISTDILDSKVTKKKRSSDKEILTRYSTSKRPKLF